jgi:phage FluMu protein Com
MNKIKKNCPRCNSLQHFNLRKRETSDGQIELYIKCSKCKWIKITKKENSSIMLEEEEIKKLKRKARKVPALQKVISEKRKKIGKINRKTM